MIKWIKVEDSLPELLVNVLGWRQRVISSEASIIGRPYKNSSCEPFCDAVIVELSYKENVKNYYFYDADLDIRYDIYNDEVDYYSIFMYQEKMWYGCISHWAQIDCPREENKND